MVSDAQATYLIKLMAQEDVTRVMRQMGVTSVNELTRVDRVLDGTRKEISGAAADAALLGKRLEESGAGARRAAGGAELYADALDEVGDEAGQATLQLTRLDARGTRAFNRLRRAAGGFGRSLGRVVTSPLTQLAGLLGTFASIQGIRVLTRDASDFETVMSEVATILPEGATGLENLDRRVKDLAVSQNKLATDVGKGLYQTISAGITDAGDALLVLEQSAKLGTAGLADTRTTVDLLTTALNAMRIEADDVEGASDSFFATVRAGKTTIDELAASIGQVLPSASALGVSLDENNAALATLTQQGFSTSNAAIVLRALYKSLIKEVDGVNEVFQRLGKNYDLNTVKQRGFLAVVQDLREGLTDEREILDVLGGRIEAFNALIGLTGQNLTTFGAVLDAVENSTGETARALEERIGPNAYRVAQAFNAVRIEATALGEAVFEAGAQTIEQLGGIEGVQRRLQALFEGLRPVVKDATTDVLNFFTGFDGFTDGVDLAVLKIERLTDRIQQFFDAVDDVLNKTALEDAEFTKGILDRLGTNAGGSLQNLLPELQRDFLSQQVPGAAVPIETLRSVEELRQQLASQVSTFDSVVGVITNLPTPRREARSAAAQLERAILERFGTADDREFAASTLDPALAALGGPRFPGQAAIDAEEEARRRAILALKRAEQQVQTDLASLSRSALRDVDAQIAAEKRLAGEREASRAARDAEIAALEDAQRRRRLNLPQRLGESGAAGEAIYPQPPRPEDVLLPQLDALRSRISEQLSPLGDVIADQLSPAMLQQFERVSQLLADQVNPALLELDSLSAAIAGRWDIVARQVAGVSGELPGVVEQSLEQVRELEALQIGIDSQIARSDAEKLDALSRQLELQSELTVLKAEELGADEATVRSFQKKLDALQALKLEQLRAQLAAGEEDTTAPDGKDGPDRLQQLRAARQENLQIASIKAQIEGAAETATGALFEDFIIGSKSAKDAFRDFAEEVVRQLVRIAAQAAASQLFQAVFGVTAGVATGGASVVAGAAAAAPQVAEQATGGITPGIGPPIPVHFYATGGVGGVARGPQAAVFGEGKNFEAYVPLPDNQRIPVQLSGAQGVTIIVRPQVIVRPFDASDFRSRIPEFSKEIGDALGRAVRNNPHVRATIRDLGARRG